MLSHSTIFINKTLCRAEAFSGILTNLAKQKLATIKLNNLNKILGKLWTFRTKFVLQKVNLWTKVKEMNISSNSENFN